MSCGSKIPTVAVPLDYSVGKLPYCCSFNLSQLQAWLHSRNPSGNWTGKIYVAKTISWNGSDFLQSGCSPNFHAGFWSLTCCKHDMRTEKTFKDALKNSDVFTFTLARKHKSLKHGGQALVSVANVTEHFPDMVTYAGRVTSEPQLRDSRLSWLNVTNRFYSWRFGDCHADLRGTRAPDSRHVHAPSHKWKKDVSSGHTMLLSDNGSFLLWSQPIIFSKRTFEWSRYGSNVDPTNLKDLLC
jgi:hypothetical protein